MIYSGHFGYKGNSADRQQTRDYSLGGKRQ